MIKDHVFNDKFTIEHTTLHKCITDLTQTLRNLHTFEMCKMCNCIICKDFRCDRLSWDC